MRRLIDNKYIRLFFYSLGLNIKKMGYFRANFIFEVLSNIIHIGVMMIFWKTLFTSGYVIPLWNWNEIIIFTAFSELFYGMKFAFSGMAGRFWILIVNGRLDTYLIRPINPQMSAVLRSIRLEQLIKSIPGFLILCFVSKVKLTPLVMLLGIVICMCGVFLLSIVELVIGYSAFKLGRVESIVEFIDALMLFNNYPLTILINPLRIIFTYLIPFMFFSTVPAQIVTGKIVGVELFKILGVLIGIIAVWICIHNYFWRRGVENYESYNG